MELHIIKFKSILTPTIWGGNEICKFKGLNVEEAGIGESWEISDLKNAESIVDNGALKGASLEKLMHTYGADLVGRNVYERYGNRFPLLIKFIDASNDLSIQVHPDDELALKRHNSFGKTEMWYVVKAKEGAGLYTGFSEKITPEEYVERVENNTFMDVLQRYQVEPGDIFFLPAGRVHAIGSGIFIAEIQQTSDITYRIYDYNRRDKEGNTRQLHTELAKDAIDYNVEKDYRTSYKQEKNGVEPVVECKYFHTNIIELDQQIERDYSTLDTFIIYMCVGGKCEITDDKGNKVSLRQGETILIPATIKKTTINNPEPFAKLLEIYIP